MNNKGYLDQVIDDPAVRAQVREYFAQLGRKGGAAGTGAAKAGRHRDRVRAGRLGGLARAANLKAQRQTAGAK